MTEYHMNCHTYSKCHLSMEKEPAAADRLDCILPVPWCCSLLLSFWPFLNSYAFCSALHSTQLCCVWPSQHVECRQSSDCKPTMSFSIFSFTERTAILSKSHHIIGHGLWDYESKLNCCQRTEGSGTSILLYHMICRCLAMPRDDLQSLAWWTFLSWVAGKRIEKPSL